MVRVIPHMQYMAQEDVPRRTVSRGSARVLSHLLRGNTVDNVMFFCNVTLCHPWDKYVARHSRGGIAAALVAKTVPRVPVFFHVLTYRCVNQGGISLIGV